ncbi:unnamed protein product [Brassicogethes aeneus]|uniref:Uncharacterized protein n=1 Tax=Brassicogethes aeneus TaxID=1431903 RepID=A0A9P0ASA3_BRAAE|nr:unnamed protein product [Brassicogethes aeneus]
MVETLIFESPVQEEPESSPIPENGDINPFPEDQDQTEAEREKVRVKFFQQSKPQEVDLPNDHDPFTDPADFSIMATQVIMNESNHVVYNRTERPEQNSNNNYHNDNRYKQHHHSPTYSAKDEIFDALKNIQKILEKLQSEITFLKQREEKKNLLNNYYYDRNYLKANESADLNKIVDCMGSETNCVVVMKKCRTREKR